MHKFDHNSLPTKRKKLYIQTYTMARVGANNRSLSLIFSLFLLASQIHGRPLDTKFERLPITAKGLSYDYYSESCPSIERVVRNYLVEAFAKNSAIAPGILHIFFHDCFASGCDASILLKFQDGELSVDQNLGFNDEVLYAIDNIRDILHKQCKRVVSCADIISIGAREAVYQLGGPYFDVPLGRRDSLTYNLSAPAIIPFAGETSENILKIFESKNYDATDVVALSGAHTIGSAHCGALVNRTTDEDPPIDPGFRTLLKSRCDNKSRATFLYLDLQTPHRFDNKYYVNLQNNRGALTSDQVLTTDARTKDIVNAFASDQNLFFERFVDVFVRMSQMDVLTGNEGEIRKSCFATNDEVSSSSSSRIQEVVELVQKI